MEGYPFSAAPPGSSFPMWTSEILDYLISAFP